MNKTLLFCGLIALLMACHKNKESGFVPAYDVPAEFQPIISDFIREAAAHGDSLSINNLVVRYDSSVSNAYCAICNTLGGDANIQKVIAVNPKIHCFITAQEREALFFHELGHCILGRIHDNRLLPNGDPRSIMVEDNIKLYSSCLYPIGGSCEDNSYKRPYYLDELFNDQTPVPPWAH